MLKSGNSRPLFYAAFTALYLLPLLVFGFQTLCPGGSWGGFLWASLIGGVGLWIFSMLFRWWESSLLTASALPTPRNERQNLYDLQGELEGRMANHDLLIQEHQRLEHEVNELGDELLRTRDALDIAISEKESILAEYQQAVSKQRASIETKQERILQLENKVRDLSFEIRTLLQVDEIDIAGVAGQPRRPGASEVEEWVDQLPASSDLEVRTQYDANVLLKRSLQTAQSLTAAHNMPGRPGRFRDLSLESLTIDLRRLFDRLRLETGGVVCLYSRSERRLLFANEPVRTLFGWSPERFVKDFASLMAGGFREWEEAVHNLSPGHERRLRVVIKSKGGTDVLVHALIGLVPQGAFEGHVIAVFYSAL
jgi:UPF0242 C-terminal PAS-like domain/Uncharacterised protein family (UPF0242) N-terminus